MASRSTLGSDSRQDLHSPRDVLIATAGHVDHGKSTLVRVMTGIDPDRLPEERHREMTIELGFASLPRPGGGRLAFIDVPVHERLVETMVAGVGSIDAALLVVAADDGPMPQTIEHLTILRLLGVSDIVVALTRTDLVDDDWITLATIAIRELLVEHGYVDAPVVTVSATTGSGMAALTTQLLAVLPRVRATTADEPNWLSIDRAFHRRGFGTIVAGTLTRGRLQRGDTVGICPAGLHATVRRLESHGELLDAAIAGQRIAVNLAGIGLDQVRRGNVISNCPIPPIDSVDILFWPARSTELLTRPRARVRVVVGTERVDATIQFPQDTDSLGQTPSLARLRFRRPIATMTGDRLIIRRPSPAATIGGGVVLARYSGQPPRLDADRLTELTALAVGNPAPTLMRRLAGGPASIEQLVDDLPGSAEDVLRRWLRDGTIRRLGCVTNPRDLLSRSSSVVAEPVWRRFAADLEDQLTSFHLDSPEALGLPLSALRSQSGYFGRDLNDLLRLAVRQGRIVQRDGVIELSGYRPRLRDSEREAAQQLLARRPVHDQLEIVSVGHLLPSTIDYLERSGEIVRIDDHRIMSARQFERVAHWVIETSQSQAINLSAVRDWVGLGRDATQRLLERMDDLGLTTRQDDGRRPGPAAPAWLRAQHHRHVRRLGQAVLDAWELGISTAPASGAAVPGEHDTFILTNPDDPIAWVTCGATILRMTRTGQSVAQVRFRRSQNGVSLELLDTRSIAMGSPSTPETAYLTPASFVELVRAVVPATDGRRYTIRIIAPLELAEDPGVMSFAGAEDDGSDHDCELLCYEDQIDVTGSDAELATRLGKLIEQGFRVETFAESFLTDDLDASVDAIMAEPGAVSSLARRFGLDPDRTGITNLVAGYHRSLTDHGLAQRFWRIRGAPTSPALREDMDRHAI